MGNMVYGTSMPWQTWLQVTGLCGKSAFKSKPPIPLPDSKTQIQILKERQLRIITALDDRKIPHGNIPWEPSLQSDNDMVYDFIKSHEFWIICWDLQNDLHWTHLASSYLFPGEKDPDLNRVPEWALNFAQSQGSIASAAQAATYKKVEAQILQWMITVVELFPPIQLSLEYYPANLVRDFLIRYVAQWFSIPNISVPALFWTFKIPLPVTLLDLRTTQVNIEWILAHFNPMLDNRVLELILFLQRGARGFDDTMQANWLGYYKSAFNHKTLLFRALYLNEPTKNQDLTDLIQVSDSVRPFMLYVKNLLDYFSAEGLADENQLFSALTKLPKACLQLNHLALYAPFFADTGSSRPRTLKFFEPILRISGLSLATIARLMSASKIQVEPMLILQTEATQFLVPHAFQSSGVFAAAQIRLEPMLMLKAKAPDLLGALTNNYLAAKLKKKQEQELQQFRKHVILRVDQLKKRVTQMQLQFVAIRNSKT
jgi:hypothetical protein